MTFLEKSITNALNFFKEAVFSEETARKNGLLQMCDPRLKIIIFLTLILTACFVRNISHLVTLYIIGIVLAAASKINIPFFIRRVWFFIPLFTLFIAIPAVFTQNMEAAVIFVLRVAVCVSFAVLMTISTRQGELFKSLKSLGAPDIFIQILDMTYRYIFFFVKVFEETHLGLKSRLIKNFDRSNAWRWISSRMGYLFKRSIKMSEEVYMAMVARGYTGEFKKYGR